MGKDYKNVENYGKVYLKESEYAKQIANQSNMSMIVNCSYHGDKINLFNEGSNRNLMGVIKDLDHNDI